MNQVNAKELSVCILCNENPPVLNSSNSDTEEIEIILLGLIQFWDIEELTLKEIDFITEFLSRKGNVNFCSLCVQRILNYDRLFQQVKDLVATFGKQLKSFWLQNYEQIVIIKEDPETGSSQENVPRKSSRKRKKRKGKIRGKHALISTFKHRVHTNTYLYRFVITHLHLQTKIFSRRKGHIRTASMGEPGKFSANPKNTDNYSWKTFTNI